MHIITKAMKLFSISLFVVLALPSLFAFQQHNQNLGYTHPAIVVKDGVSYISVQTVPAGKDINSPDYWTPLLNTAPTDEPGDAPTIDGPTDSNFSNLTPPEDNATLSGGRLINLSTRGYVGTGERRLVGGFKVYGAELPLIIRGFGPSHNLTNKSLEDPLLVWKTAPTSLKSETDGVISEVDDYDQNSRLTGVSTLAQSKIDKLIAKETADIQTASNWNNNRTDGYTAYIIAQAEDQAGVGRIGINDLTDFNGSGQLVNISTRGYVGDNDDHYLVAGFNIRGGSMQVCIRAFGPSMSLAGETSLVDPVLEIIQQVSSYHTEKKVLYMNDNWKEDFSGTSDITPFNITSSKTTVPYYLNKKLLDNEAAMVVNLETGNYTARVYGKNGGTGIGRVGIDKIVDEWNVSQ
jgi:hypothetical protein